MFKISEQMVFPDVGSWFFFLPYLFKEENFEKLYRIYSFRVGPNVHHSCLQSTLHYTLLQRNTWKNHATSLAYNLTCLSAMLGFPVMLFTLDYYLDGHVINDHHTLRKNIFWSHIWIYIPISLYAKTVREQLLY